jgi:uncharacterized membrane protein YfcA
MLKLLIVIGFYILLIHTFARINYSIINKLPMKMSISMILILIGIGIFTGAVAGMLGIGGAVILIPALIFILGFSQYDAQGTSVAMMLPPIGLLAAYNYYKAGHVNLYFALILAIAFMLGAYFGSKIALNLPQAVLRKIFAVLLLATAVKMFLTK